MATPTYRLTYFPVQARAEVIRLLFRYANVDFEDVRLNKDQWSSVKSEPKYKFDQLPLLEVNGKAVTQSQAIARYVAQKFGYLPTDPDAALSIDELATFINSDISDRQYYGSLFQDTEGKEAYRKDYFENQLPKKLAFLEKTLEGNTSGFLIGDSITLADFILIDFAQRVLYDKDWIERTRPVLEKLPNLTAYFMKRFEDPKYKAYFETKPEGARNDFKFFQ